MTDREIIEKLIEKTKNDIVVSGQYNDIDGSGHYMEITNTCIGENISFDFDEEGNLIEIYT